MSKQQRPFQCVGRILQALNITEDSPVDGDLLRLLDLAAASSEVAAFFALAAINPGVLLSARLETPDWLSRAIATAGLADSKFWTLAPRVLILLNVLAQQRL